MTAPQAPTRKRRHFPRLRIMTWIVLIFNAGMLAWIIAATATSHPSNCGTLSAQGCNTANNVGTTIGVGLLIGLWVAGDVILGIIWLVTRPSRHCPACGHGVRRGRTTCKSCGYDFAAAVQRPATA